MDDLDSRLIAALRRDGRASVSELAGLLGVTRSTVRARLARLRAEGEVVGFTVVTRAEAAQAPVRGLMMIQAEARGTDRVLARLAGLPEVTAIHSTNGTWDLIAEIGTPTLEALDQVLSAIRRFEGVTRSETSLLLTSVRPGRPLRRPAARAVGRGGA